MAPATPEATVLKAVFAPEKLAVGTGIPGHERWAKSVLERQLTEREALKRKLREGQEIAQDTTQADVKGIRGKIESIGTDIDAGTGEWQRVSGSPEESLHAKATDGLAKAEQLLQYESLPPSEQAKLQLEVIKALQETPGGKAFFDSLTSQKDKKDAVDGFIRAHKKDIATLMQNQCKTINEAGGRFDSTQATDTVFDKEQKLEETRQKLENAQGDLTSLDARLKQLEARKAEFDTPATGNAGKRLQQLEKEEPIINQDLVVFEEAITRQTEHLDRLNRRVVSYENDPQRAKKDGVDIAKLKQEYEEGITKLRQEKAAQKIALQRQQELTRLRAERDRLPQETKTTQDAINQKKLEVKKVEVEVKKAADHVRRARDAKAMMDEDLATVTADLWKNVIKECAGKEIENMIDLIMSTEGMDHIQAEMLTLIDRKTEEEWTEKQKRWRMGTRFGGRVPAIRSPVNELVSIPKRSAINAAFDALMADTDGSGTTAKLKGIVGAQEWDSLPRDQQHELEAAYVVKLVGRRQEALGVSLRAEEIRRIRSGPFADALIKQGLAKNPEFRQALTGSPDLTTEELAKPTAETVQKIKGKLDGGTLMTVLMLGLTPLSMIKTSEEHR